MKICYSLFLFSIIFSSGAAAAQEILPVYSDYLIDNLYLLHPSMAGASNRNKIRLTAREQWFSVEDAPALQTVNLHARLNDRTGVGGIIINDQNGYFSRRGAYATLAYHLMFSRSDLDLNQLSFGISGGIIQHSLDQSEFTEFDPLLGDGNAADIYGNVDVGMSYYYFNFFAHLRAKNIFPVRRDLFYSGAIPSNQRQYLLSSGYVIETFRRWWSYEPSLMIIWKEASGEKIVDLNLKIYRDFATGTLFGGLSYRRSLQGMTYLSEGENRKSQFLQYLTPFAGLEYKNFLFAYTYSQQFNKTVLSNSGFHQITLGYNFGENRGRYECYCPGINQSRRR